MNLIEFYKKVLDSLGLIYTDDGFIKIKFGKAETLVTVDGKPLVLPTKEHIKTMIKPDENGEMKLTKILFNPLKEDIIKGESLSLKKLKTIIEINLSQQFATVGELLIKLAMNVEIQKDASMEINKFLVSLKEASKTAKVIADDKQLKNWVAIFKKALEAPANQGLIHIFLKKGGKIDGIKFAKVAVSDYPVKHMLEKADKNTPVLGVVLRNKDIGVFKSIYDFTLEDYKIGSNDGIAPGFIALFKMYMKITDRLNSILEKLKFVEVDTVENAIRKIEISEDLINNISVFKNEIELIPSDMDANRLEAMKNQQPEQVIEQQDDSDVLSIIRGRMDTVQQPVQYQQPVQQIPQQAIDTPPWETPQPQQQVSQSVQQISVQQDDTLSQIYGDNRQSIQPVQPIQQGYQQPMYPNQGMQQGYGYPQPNAYGGYQQPIQQQVVTIDQFGYRG